MFFALPSLFAFFCTVGAFDLAHYVHHPHSWLNPFPFEHHLGNLLNFPVRTGSIYMDIVESSEKEYTVHADLPGVRLGDVDVSIDQNNILTVKGTRSHEYKDEDTIGGRIERSWGSYIRSIKLPKDANPETPKATFEDGVLKVKFERISEAECASPRKIEVTSPVDKLDVPKV